MQRNLRLIQRDIEGENEGEDFSLEVSEKKNRLWVKDVKRELDFWGVIDYSIKNSNHIKIGNINFYPSTGTCYVDGNSASYKEKGLEFLKKLLKKKGLIPLK